MFGINTLLKFRDRELIDLVISSLFAFVFCGF